MVLPLRVSAKGGAEIYPAELAHTLDISPRGARLGAVHHELQIGTRLMIQYHQRRIESRAVWIRRLEGTNEYQVGVELLTNGCEVWGIDLRKVNTADEPEAELVTV